VCPPSPVGNRPIRVENAFAMSLLAKFGTHTAILCQIVEFWTGVPPNRGLSVVSAGF